MMRRREFITLSGGAAAAWPLAARAQQLPLPVVGWLRAGAPMSTQYLTAFRLGLNDLSYVEGRSVTIEYRNSEQYDRLPALAADLIRRQRREIELRIIRSVHERVLEIPLVMQRPGARCPHGERCRAIHHAADGNRLRDDLRRIAHIHDAESIQIDVTPEIRERDPRRRIARHHGVVIVPMPRTFFGTGNQ